MPQRAGEFFLPFIHCANSTGFEPAQASRKTPQAWFGEQALK